MPPKRIKKPKQKPKQKQKQKQIVKQNVKVTVQSSGGSGGGGTPSYLPQQYNDTRQLGLLDEIARSVRKAPEVAPVRIITENIPNPANDNATLNGVFNAPINSDVPVQLGLNSSAAPAKPKKPTTARKVGSGRKKQEPVVAEVESEYSPMASGAEDYISQQFMGFEKIGKNRASNLSGEAMGGKKENPTGRYLFGDL